MLPSRNFYLVGMEGSHQWQQKQVNWYIEGLSTRNSGNKKGYVYTHHIYKNGYYQQGFPLGASIGGDGNMIATKLELVEGNNRYSARLVYAKVNPNNQSINKAFPNADTLYGTKLGWKTTLINDQLMLEPKLWYVHSKNDSDHHIGVNLTAEWFF